MAEIESVLIWMFGILAAALTLASIVRRRRDHLVGLLRTHVEKEIGPTLTEEAETDDEVKVVAESQEE